MSQDASRNGSVRILVVEAERGFGYRLRIPEGEEA